MADIDTHNLTIDFGKHKGMAWTRAPVGYLFWIVNQNPPHSRHDIAQAELDRRGSVRPEMEVSGHAIDRASLQCRKIWHETRHDGEGIHAWLVRMATEARNKAVVDHKGRYLHQGMKFAFEDGAEWPSLKTVMPQ